MSSSKQAKMASFQVFTFAFISRLCIIFIQCVANAVLPDHDAGVFDPPKQNVTRSLDFIVDLCFGGLRRWDAIYFTHIAQYGYTYENCIAFFPCYPMVVSLFSRLLSMIGILQIQQCILLTGTVLNCVLFSLTASNLYTLGIETGLDRITSLLSVIIYCLNPASIFMTALYSESLYFFLLTLSLLYLKRGFVYLPSVFIAFSVLARSNGLVGIGFILYNIFLHFITEFFSGRKGKKHFLIEKRLFFFILIDVLKIILCIVTCFSPFLLYQYYIYTQFCFMSNSSESVPGGLIDYGRVQGYKITGDTPSSWCFQTFPISYSYIQAKHWGVGFLKYYRLKQIPNFLLAAPVVMLSLNACVFFFNMNPKAFKKLGFMRTVVEKVNKSKDDKHTKGTEKINRHLLADQMVVYVVHLAFLTIFGCFFIHIQVLTRFLFSSTPLLYWYTGFILTKNTTLVSHLNKLIVYEPANKEAGIQIQTDGSLQGHQPSDITCRRSMDQHSHCDTYYTTPSHLWSSNVCFKFVVFILRNWNHLTWGSKAILIYCISYCVIGTVMFSNFLPWT